LCEGKKGGGKPSPPQLRVKECPETVVRGEPREGKTDGRKRDTGNEQREGLEPEDLSRGMPVKDPAKVRGDLGGRQIIKRKTLAAQTG